MARTRSDAELFGAYFDLADEIDESLRAGADQATPSKGLDPLVVADMNPDFVAIAEQAAAKFGLPWFPVLHIAEDYALDHPELRI